MNAIEVPINGERLIADLRRLREFGACGTGVVRTSLSPVDLDSRRWLCRRLEEAGLDARIDGAGNVIGRSRNPGKRSSSAPTPTPSRPGAGSTARWA